MSVVLRSASLLLRVGSSYGLGLLFTGTALAASVMPLSQPEQRVALVIGNYSYDDAPLRNPGNDVDDMAMALSALGFQVDKRKNTTRAELLDALVQFGHTLRMSNGIGLLYYSGHGVQVHGENYLVPVAAKMLFERDVESESVSLSRVMGILNDAGNPSNILILDACRNNPFTRRYRAASRGLALMRAPNGTIIAFSTAPGEVAEDGNERNGTYTKHLLAQIGQPTIQVEEVFKRVRTGVIQETAGRQVPWEMSSLTTNVILKGSATMIIPMGRGTARLEIDTVPPQAMLFLDQRAIGSAPITLTDLAGGWPLIRAEFPDGRVREQRVALTDGAQVRATLLPDTYGANLNVTSVPPEATVFVNEFPVGTTPRQLSGLTTGKYRIRVSHVGFDDWVRDVEIMPDSAPPNIEAQLERSAGSEYEDRLSDGSRGPAMVVVKAGCFMMGSGPEEAGRDSDENQHEVCLPHAFGISKFELTVGDFQRFVEASGYKTDAELDRERGCFAWSFDDNKWGWRSGMTWRDPRLALSADTPITCVSWNDATAFTLWLSAETGKTYRLPTEAEWEYAARGGHHTTRFWGTKAEEACRFGNVLDTTRGPQNRPSGDEHACRDGFSSIAPVGRFRENTFGLHDVLGNVWEWTCSVYQPLYDQDSRTCGAGSAAIPAPRVIRGGSWNYGPLRVRAANRNFARSETRFFDVGIRLAAPITTAGSQQINLSATSN